MSKKTITVDLETWTPSVLSNTTSGIHPFPMLSYQKNTLDTMKGYKPGEMMIITGGRQTGKSMLNQWFSTNLCKEITLTGKQLVQEFTINWGEPVSKYKFSRAKWYEGKFNWKQYDEVHEWCEQNFGKHDKCPDAWSRWNHMYEDMILFRDEKDYMLFVLRWS